MAVIDTLRWICESICRTYVAHEFVLNVIVNVLILWSEHENCGPDVSVLPHVGTHSLGDVVAHMNQKHI